MFFSFGMVFHTMYEFFTNNMFVTDFGWELIDSILSYENSEPNYTISQELLDRAFEAGKQLIK